MSTFSREGHHTSYRILFGIAKVVIFLIITRFINRNFTFVYRVEKAQQLKWAKNWHSDFILLWIAFRFCIFVLWTQFATSTKPSSKSCELLSDFVYSFFEHNNSSSTRHSAAVVNCFQILYIRSLNTMTSPNIHTTLCCELLSDFVYSFFEHNWFSVSTMPPPLWIAFRFCIFVLWTQSRPLPRLLRHSCELLSDFVYSFFEHNALYSFFFCDLVVNCFQILYIRSLNTIVRALLRPPDGLWIAFRFCIFVLWTQYCPVHRALSYSCELLSDFVYSFFEHNACHFLDLAEEVVNCFQILYIRSLNTITVTTVTTSQ